MFSGLGYRGSGIQVSRGLELESPSSRYNMAMGVKKIPIIYLISVYLMGTIDFIV